MKEETLITAQSDEVSTSEYSAQDDAPKKTYFKAMMGVFISGVAFMSDGYNQGVVTMANVLLKKLYPEYTSTWSTRVSNAMLVGNIIGQLSFGFIVDRIGRRQGFALTTALIVIGAALCAGASGNSMHGMLWMLVICRGIVGVGVGGEYPASAASAIEAADEHLGKDRVIPFVLSTNLPVSMGTPVAVSCFLIFLSIWGENHLRGVWRTSFGFGAFLPMAIFYFRWRLQHAKTFQNNAIKRRVPYMFILKKYWRSLIGSAGMWFIMDFILYPNNIFGATVISLVIPKASIRRTAEWDLFLSIFGVFGTLLGAFACKFFSRKQIIQFGFLFYAVVSIVVGAAFPRLKKIPALFIVLYAILNATVNFGPANLQSLVSSEAFPTAIRGTCYGFSAAVGKAGAAVGTQVFQPIQKHAGDRYTFIVSGAVCFIGFTIVHFFLPDNGNKSLAEMDEELNESLRAHGWNGPLGEKENQ